MDVREKLVELQSIITCPNAICNFCEHFKNKDACEKHKKEVIADNMIAHGVTVQEWVPVSEPPKEKGTYIVCTDKGGILLGHWYGKEWNVGGGAKKHLAYWMKKPQPPKGE